MKNNKREILLTSLVCLLPLFAGAALYPRLPETMATHWDFSGNARKIGILCCGRCCCGSARPYRCSAER